MWAMTDTVSTQGSSATLEGRSVIVLTDSLSEFGGTERYTVTICQALAACDIAIEVFAVEPIRDPTWADILAARGITVHAPATWELGPELWERLNRHIAADRPALVLVNPIGTAFVDWLSSAPRGTPIPPIVGVEYSQPGQLTAHWYPATLPRLINHLDAVITTCDASRQGVIQHFGYRGPTYVVPHLIHRPVSAPKPPSARHKLGIVARLSVEKGIEYALAAVALLERQRSNVELNIYGAGADAGRLTELAACLGIQARVHLRGTFHPVDDLDETLARHAVWIQPSLFESVPTSLLELAARGRTVIATDVGGVAELFHSVPGARNLLVLPADTRALADRIRSVLAETGYYGRISRALQQHVLIHHAPENVVPQLLNVLLHHSEPVTRISNAAR